MDNIISIVPPMQIGRVTLSLALLYRAMYREWVLEDWAIACCCVGVRESQARRTSGSRIWSHEGTHQHERSPLPFFGNKMGTK